MLNERKPMSVTCADRERIFENGTTDEWNSLESHATGCPECAEELHAWQSLSIAAQELRDYSESPQLWPKIRRELATEAERAAQRSNRWAWLRFLEARADAPVLGWQTALVGVFVLVLTVSVAWIALRPTKTVEPTRTAASPLLKDTALAEVERAEQAYEQAIEKLAVQAKPQLENPATPLLASYHEKLLVIDSAIEDLRVQAGINPSNAHLRRQLLAMYQEKQQTLEDVLEAKAQ